MSDEIIVETPRLLLRVWQDADIEAYWQIYGDAEVWLFIAGEPFADIEHAELSLARTAEYHQEHGFSQWAVVERASGKIIGSCGFTWFRGGPALELAYHFARDYWQRGYATEAVRAVIDYGFKQLHADKIVALIDPLNYASQRVAEKSGLINKWVMVDENDNSSLYYELRVED